MSETAAIAGCLGVLLAAGLVERLLRDRARAAVPIRVHVNGTRGKSTVTRLIAAALRAHGVPTVARVTGTEAREILPDGTERPVRRLGPANIREELRFLLLARRLGARAAVVECMAIRPDLQHAAEREMVRATIGVITNVRTDHTEVMGTSLAEIAASLAATVPRGSILVLGSPDFGELFRERATELGTRVVVAGPRSSEGLPWLEEDVATALAVTRLLGVPDVVARAAMASAAADPGAFRERIVSVAGREVALLDARAANDPESFALLCRTSVLLSPVTGPVLAIYNHRHDRPDRLRRFVPSLAALPGARTCARTGCAATTEQPLEEIAEAFAAAHALLESKALPVAATETALSKALACPLAEVRRRAEVLARAIALRAQLIVGDALFLVAKHFVGFVDGLETLLGAGLLADVRVVLAREPAIGGLDLRLARAGLDAKRLVVILELHAPTPANRPAAETPRASILRLPCPMPTAR